MLRATNQFDPYAGYFDWWVSTPSAPAPPNPYETAQAQEQSNVASAIASSVLNDVNQNTPYGSIDYTRTGSDSTIAGIDVPQFTATTTLSPQMQALFNANIANSQAESGIQGQLAQNAASELGQPLDLSPGAITSNLVNLGNKELQPQIQQAQTALNQQLADQGLTPGSAGWDYQQQQFGLNSAQAENDLILQGQNTAMQQLMAQYNEPLNALTALQSGSQVSQPGIGTLARTTTSPIAPAPISQDVYNSANLAEQNYSNELQSSNALTSGLFGLGGSLIKGGLGLFSDRDDKTDIEPLGRDPDTGLMIHAYRYKDDPKSYPKTVGPMAQDVEKKDPNAVQSIGGHKVIAFGLGK